MCNFQWIFRESLAEVRFKQTPEGGEEEPASGYLGKAFQVKVLWKIVGKMDEV